MAARKPQHSGSKAANGKSINRLAMAARKPQHSGSKAANVKSNNRKKDSLAPLSADKPPEGLSRHLQKKLTVERRKKRNKPLFELGKEVGALWESLRQRNLSSTERSRLITSILEKMKGKIPEMVTSHVTSRVLQTCLKYCNPAEKASIYEELRPHFLTLAQNTYAHHLVEKMLEQADKAQLQQMISMLHGHVVAFLRHPVASAVVECAYGLANSLQKQELLAEFFSPEFRLFKGIMSDKVCRLVDFLANEPSSKRNSILEHMTVSLQPILEKGIVDHSIIHRALVEYLSIASKTTTIETVQQLSGPLLVRMVHTKDGAKIGVTCVATGSRKEWKKIIKGLKGNAMKVGCDQHGHSVLLAILDWVDDTELVNKFIISELAKNIKEIAFNKYGRRVFLHLLSPSNNHYIQADLLAALQCRNQPLGQNGVQQKDKEEDSEERSLSSKKDPFLRRTELLKSSALAEKLLDVCSADADELLRSPLGKDLVYEVARGGADGILWLVVPDGVVKVHEALANLAAHTRSSEKEHVFEHYFASRTIRKLLVEPAITLEGVNTSSFAYTLWKAAMKGRCKEWANGHSKKIVSAFALCHDPKVKKKAMVEIQPLIDSGLLQDVSVLPEGQGVKRKKPAQ